MKLFEEKDKRRDDGLDWQDGRHGPVPLLAIDACRVRGPSFDATFIFSTLSHHRTKIQQKPLNKIEMADAAAAREARRKAILSRGNDRLNKLASSARGEDYVANISKPGVSRATARY